MNFYGADTKLALVDYSEDEEHHISETENEQEYSLEEIVKKCNFDDDITVEKQLKPFVPAALIHPFFEKIYHPPTMDSNSIHLLRMRDRRFPFNSSAKFEIEEHPQRSVDRKKLKKDYYLARLALQDHNYPKQKLFTILSKCFSVVKVLLYYII